jgi:serine O-acetyltransferase
MNPIIKADLYRYVPHTYNFKNLIKGFREPGFIYTYIIRKSANHKKYSFLGIFYRILHRRLSFKFGYQIPVITKIGEGFYIGHFGNVIISPRAVIGNNCNIAPGVTIGAIMSGHRKGAPIIGNKVWMGINSILVGRINIGSDVMIAPGAFVNFDVPDHSLVIGNPGKIIPKENPTSGYIENCLEN